MNDLIFFVKLHARRKTSTQLSTELLLMWKKMKQKKSIKKFERKKLDTHFKNFVKKSCEEKWNRRRSFGHKSEAEVFWMSDFKNGNNNADKYNILGLLDVKCWILRNNCCSEKRSSMVKRQPSRFGLLNVKCWIFGNRRKIFNKMCW